MTTPSGRLLSLLSLLQARRDWPGEALADRLGVSRRTVRRDVDRLRELGYPVQTTKGPAGGYRLAPGADLPPLLLDDEQAVAVAVALQTAALGVVGVEEAAVRALATIRQVMPSRLRHRVDALQVLAVPPTSAPTVAVDPGVLLQVGECCRDHQVLRFDYTDKEGASSLRRVEPHRLVSRGRRWYAVGWDLDRDGWRTFRVDRMRPRAPVGPRFAARELSDAVVADLVRPPGEDAWPARGRVVLHAPAAQVARWVRPDQGTVTPRDDGSCTVEVGSWSWPSLAAWLLMFEADFEVLDPPELVTALEDITARVARAARASAG
ncbi:helix-turn-helix transcriptional regulator [Ornithinimicrobium cerasi]|uniref:BirA biotin operon repressor domain-containing protein n=1 Tax=Ornithinimicrobium cerasi TaxID=2248773 RepID=A0A285VKN9_9MICO|nr:WYL domain-containing protein [Ornithinimicrobium cerasi]SOC53756.1 BirA biotin operon repressor domain-containing protein [Ornithinimicrobium cerasi]